MKWTLIFLLTVFSSVALSSELVTIYKEKNIKSEVVEKVNGYDELLTIFIDGNWSKVENSSNGKTGWIENK